MKKLSHQKLWTLCIGTTLLVGFFATLHLVSAERSESAEARLQRIEDREEIRELLTDYGRYLDKRDFDSFSRLFAEKEGEWIGGMGKAKGRQAILKLMEDTIGRDTRKERRAQLPLVYKRKDQRKRKRSPGRNQMDVCGSEQFQTAAAFLSRPL